MKLGGRNHNLGPNFVQKWRKYKILCGKICKKYEKLFFIYIFK